MTLTAAVVINDRTPAPSATVQRTNGSYGPRRALGAVHLGDLTIQTTLHPDKFRELAAAFTEAADLMDATNTAIDEERQQAAADSLIDARLEADQAAQDLGYHDDDCRAEIEHDAMLDEIASTS